MLHDMKRVDGMLCVKSTGGRMSSGLGRVLCQTSRRRAGVVWEVGRRETVS